MKTYLSPALTWSHFGRLHRVGVWPEAGFERESDGRWERYVPDALGDEFVAAAIAFKSRHWTAYLDFVPAEPRAFLEQFKTRRLEVIAVLSQCPGLWPDLQAVPALTAFLAAHTELRGVGGPRWNEINVVHERSGLFGLLEWLGLPATKDGLNALKEVADPDIGRKDLGRVRSHLWALSDRARRHGHALAA